jgi:hypothetical protein
MQWVPGRGRRFQSTNSTGARRADRGAVLRIAAGIRKTSPYRLPIRFFIRTPAPPPFSGINSTPAFSGRPPEQPPFRHDLLPAHPRPPVFRLSARKYRRRQPNRSETTQAKRAQPSFVSLKSGDPSASGCCSPPFRGWLSLSWLLLLAELLLGAVNQPFKRAIRDQTEPG